MVINIALGETKRTSVRKFHPSSSAEKWWTPSNIFSSRDMSWHETTVLTAYFQPLDGSQYKGGTSARRISSEQCPFSNITNVRNMWPFAILDKISFEIISRKVHFHVCICICMCAFGECSRISARRLLGATSDFCLSSFPCKCPNCCLYLSLLYFFSQFFSIWQHCHCCASRQT